MPNKTAAAAESKRPVETPRFVALTVLLLCLCFAIFNLKILLLFNLLY